MIFYLPVFEVQGDTDGSARQPDNIEYRHGAFADGLSRQHDYSHCPDY
jgi:hypothetical protein